MKAIVDHHSTGADLEDRRSWFGLGGRPSLPEYLRPEKGRRLKGLDEFTRPPFVGRMARVERRRTVGWWMLIAGGFAGGVGLGLMLFR